MAYVMISYCHLDRKFVDNLAESLRQRNIEIHYDQDLVLGEDYRRKIDKWIEDLYAVLVVWSDAACESEWVSVEAEDARTRQKLVQVAISKDCKLPKPFGARNYGDLTSWDGNPNHPVISKIIDAVTELADRGPIKQQKIECTHDIALDFAEVKRTLRDKASIDVLKFLAHGEISDIYQGRCGTRLVSIKAIIGAKLSDADREMLTKEAEMASDLRHPSFMRLSRTIFDNSRCFIVTDYTDGETIARALSRGDKFSIGDVVEIISQLSEAIPEAHERGMQHLRIIPSEIFVDIDKVLRRKIVRFAPINFTYFLERLHAKNNAVWKEESGPFMAPELQLRDEDDSSEEGERLLIQKANQFALGMVAWTMLEGCVPFASAQQQLPLKTILNFNNATTNFPERVLTGTWADKARALARIIARMVAADPAKRWADMKQVNMLISALAASYNANQLENSVKEAYRRLCCGNAEFYARFYENLFRRVSSLRAKFPSDMTKQHRMLDFALGQLLNYSQQQCEPTTLTQFVERHERMGLSADDFKHFGNALVETFDSELSHDAERQRTMAALEIVIWPGVYYLMEKCAPKSEVEKYAMSA